MPAGDRPDNETIQDDEAIDKWFDQWQRDVAEMASQNRKGRKSDGLTQDEAFSRIPQYGGK